jgi:hypothetical protein
MPHAPVVKSITYKLLFIFILYCDMYIYFNYILDALACMYIVVGKRDIVHKGVYSTTKLHCIRKMGHSS